MGWAEAMHRKVEKELRPLRDAIEGSTGKWNLFRSRAELATTTFGPLEKYVAANDNLSVAQQPAGIRRDWEGNVSAIMRDGTGRRGDWLQTFSGRQFWPMDPRASEVAIEDIAHSLSMQCRYAGHCLRFYSVAEHSVLLTRFFRQKGASLTTQLWALLHDASEAYLVDVPRPVKPFLSGYKDAEARVMRAICDRFDLPHEMPDEVHAADGAIIADERFNMTPCATEWGATGSGLGVYLRNWQPEVAEAEFLDEFRRIQRWRQEERRAA